MARSNLRLVAGAGVVAAFLLIGDPFAAVAMADTRVSQSSHSDDGKRPDQLSSGTKRDGPKRGGDDSRDQPKADDDPCDDTKPKEGDNSPGAAVGTNGKNEPTDGAGPQVSRTSSIAAAEVPATEAPVSPGRSDSAAPSGAEQQARALARSPRVTVGNGRAPGIVNGSPEPARETVPAPAIVPVAFEPAPVPPVVPQPGGAPSNLPLVVAPTPWWINLFYLPPTRPTVLGTAPPTMMNRWLFGLAGLLLIPAAGAVLGYRQARAAQAAEVLVQA